MKLYILIPFPYGHDRIQVFPKAPEDSKVKLREVKRKLVKKERGSTHTTKGKFKRRTPQGKAKGKEAGKATIHPHFNTKSRQSVQPMDKKARQRAMRTMLKLIKLNQRTLDKARKKGCTVG